MFVYKNYSMINKTEKLLEELVVQIKDKSELLALQDKLFKRGVENLLEAEMKAHLGYQKGATPAGDNIRNGYSTKTLKSEQGQIPIKIPRDRQASFDPITVPKHQTMTKTIEESILLLYSKGMSTADITDFVKATYGVKYSTSKISLITNSLLEDINEWRTRPVEDVYAILWIDAIHYKIRQDGKVQSKACMVVLGIDLAGKQDVLGLYIIQNESAAGWLNILTDLQNRGLKDVLFLCSDNLKGVQNAVQTALPATTHQICIVHQIRNSLKCVSYKDRKELAKAIKTIYQANDEQCAQIAFEQFKEQYQDKYGYIVKSWENNWEALTAFLAYPAEIRKLIYTTNIIESFNASLRKYTRNKKVFPNDQAAMKSIYLAAQQIKGKWKKTRFNWSKIYNQLYIYFEDRIS